MRKLSQDCGASKMFNEEIDKYWRVLNLRLSRAEYLLKHELPELEFKRFGDTSNLRSESVVLQHLHIKPKSDSNSLYVVLCDQSELMCSEALYKIRSAHRLTYEDRNDNSAIEPMLSINSICETNTGKDPSAAKRDFMNSIEVLFRRSANKTPLELFPFYERKRGQFGPGNIRLTDTDFGIACRRSGLERNGSSTFEILANLESDCENIWKALKR